MAEFKESYTSASASRRQEAEANSSRRLSSAPDADVTLGSTEAALRLAEDRVAELARANETLLQTTERLAANPSLDSFLGFILLEAALTSGADAAHLAVYEPETDSLRTAAIVEDGVLCPLPLDPILQRKSARFPDILLRERKPQTFDIAADANLFWSKALAFHQSRAHCKVVSVPILIGDSFYGQMDLVFVGGDDLSADKSAVLSALCNQAALSIHLVRLSNAARKAAIASEREKAASERAEELARANEAMRAGVDGLVRLQDLDLFLGQMLRAAAEAAGAHTGAVVLLAADRTHYRFAAVLERSGALTLPGAVLLDPIPVTAQLEEWIGTMIHSPEGWPLSPEDPLHAPETLAFHKAQGNLALRHIPMMADGRLAGWLGLGFADAEPALAQKYALLRVLADQMTMAVEMLRLAEAAKETAIAKERELEAEVRAAEATRISSFLGATIRQMSGRSDLRLTIDSIVAGLAKEIGATHVFLFRHDPETRLLRLELSWIEGHLRHGPSGDELPLWAAPFPDNITPGWQIMVMNGGGLFTPQMVPIPAEEFAWPGTFEYAARNNLSDMGHILLFGGDEPVGSIGFGLTDGRRLRPADKPFIEGVAQQAALAIQMLDLVEEAKQRAVEETEKKAAQERAEELALANESLAHVVGLLHAVGRFAEMILASRDFSQLHEALAMLGEAVVADRVYTFMIQGSPSIARLDQSWSGSQVAPLPEDLFILESEMPDVFVILRRGEAYQGHPEIREGVNAELNDQVQTLSDLILPITMDGELVGAIGFDDCHNVRSWSEEEIRVLKSAAATIAAAIQRQQAEVEAQEAVAQEREKAAQEREFQALRRAEELSRSNAVLSDCIRDLKDIEDLEGFLESVLLASERISGSAGVAAFVYGSDHRLFMKAYVQGGTPRDILNDPEMAVWRDPVEWTHGFSEIWKDICGSRGYWLSLADDPKIDRKYRDWHKHRGQSFTLCVPLTQGDRFLGCLGLAFRNNQQVNPERVELIRSLAQQTTLAVEANRLALQARDEAVRREQQRAVHERAAELVKANEALRNCVDEITQQVTADGILGSFLGQAVKVSGSAAGAILRRIGATEFEFVLVHRDGITASAEDVISAESNDEVRRASAADPKGYFADIAAGKPRWRRVDEILDDDLPTITQFQKEAGNQMLYDFPYRSGGEVAGYLALAFVSPEPPSVVVQETISALATQVGLALEFRRISVQMEQAAVEKEQEKAARERAAELTKANQALQATADAIATSRELDEIVPAILKIIARTFEGPSAAYYEIGDDSTIYLRYYINEGSVISGAELLAGDGAPPYDLPKILAAGFKVSKEYSGAEDYRKLKTRVIDHRRGTSEPMFDAWRRKHNREMELNIPLMMGGQPLGVLTLSREAQRPYTEAEIELAEAVVKQFCLAVQASRIAEDSRQKAVAIAIAQEQEMAAQTAAAEMTRANNELALRNRLLSVVADVSTRLARIGDISASLQEALETIGVAGQFSRVLVLEERQRPLPEEGSDHLVRAEWCAPEIESHADFGTSVIPSDIAEVFLSKLRLGDAFWCRIEDVPYPMRYMCERMGIKATGCAPLMVDGGYWGNVAFDDCVRPEPWDTAHVDALKAIAQAISNALQARRDAERLASEREIAARERATALARANQSLRSGANVLSQSSSPEDVLSLVLEQAMDVTGADTATLVERNGEGNEFSFRTFLVNDGNNITNISDPSRMPKFHLTPLDDTYFSHLLQGKPGQIRIDAEVARRCPASEHIFCREGDGVMWAFPFMTQGVLKGYMALGFDARHPPDSVGLETAEALACQASLVLETLSLTERTKALEAVREREMAVQSERTRLSEEMHDGLQQTMAAISLQVGSALVQIRQDPQGMQIRKPLKRAAELAEQGLKEIRDSVRDLSAGTISSTWAFVDAVSKLCTSIDTDSTRCVAKITCELNELPASSLQNIYRVIQEAAQNVVKHAGARYMEITVRSTPDSFIFSVSDDGCGITLSPAPVGGMGFKLMKERARRVGGRLEIGKLERGGTQVSLIVEKPPSKVQ